MNLNTLSDPSAERAILSGIFNYGGEVYFDIVDMLSENTFTIESNQCIFKCLKHILDKDDQQKLDIPSLYSAAHEIGLKYFFDRTDEARHLQAVISLNVDPKNIRKFAAKIRKLEIARLLRRQLGIAEDKLLEITGEESVAHILSIAEDAALDLSSLLNQQTDAPQKLGAGIEEYLQYLEDNPVNQIGISTGYAAFDRAIGGGLRKGTVNVLGGRAKSAKTVITDNIGTHIAGNIHIPVLNMDTEMTREDHIHRTLACLTETAINDIETGKFATIPDVKNRVKKAGVYLSSIPYYHRSIAGMPFEDQLSIMRRWVIQDVGLNNDGTAKDCVIIYDYLKLMDTSGLANLQEYQLLGFMMTTLHNFAVRYKIPIIALIQLNRDGINKESTDVASGSDRIIWLCSNFSIFKVKSIEEIALDGPQNGNRKMVVLAARHGAGMDDGDYINYHFKGWCAKITEGQTKFELNQNKKKDSGFEVEDDNPDEPVQL